MCDCKEADQTMEHLFECPLLRQTCSLDDLMVYNGVQKNVSDNGSDWCTTRQEEEDSKAKKHYF